MALAESTIVDEIEATLRSYPWLDCELHTLRHGGLAVVGGVALHRAPPLTPDVVLYFADVFLVSALRTWSTDTDHRVLTRHDGAEAIPLGLPFRVDQGYSIYRLQPEDLDGACWIAARSLRMKQMRRPEEPLSLPPGWSGGGGWQAT
ncbi:MAG: hypothetical protein ABJE95_35525 [Byssovorax sp.]